MAIRSSPMPTWRTLDDAARQTGVSRRTLTRWISQGRLTAYTVAGDLHRYVDLDQIKKLREPKPIPTPKGGR
jgi:excisionase family DNA binding protein